MWHQLKTALVGCKVGQLDPGDLGILGIWLF